jgi:hypothetical protein
MKSRRPRASGLAAATLCLLAPWPGKAQEGRVDDVNFLQWFIYSGDHPVAGRWGVHLEAQARRTRLAMRWQQLLLRPAVNVDLTQRVQASFGYAYARSYPYGGFPDPSAFPENRIYEQVSFEHGAGPLSLTHRLRIEQRFIGEDTEWRYQNRFRYLLEADLPLTARNYLELSAETMARTHGRGFDQERLYAGVGREVARNWRIEAGYLYQYIVPRTGPVFEHNHVFQFSILSSVPF